MPTVDIASDCHRLRKRHRLQRLQGIVVDKAGNGAVCWQEECGGVNLPHKLGSRILMVGTRGGFRRAQSCRFLLLVSRFARARA
jgi:hypothetical protein